MKYWFVPSNDYTYRIGDSIKENHGVADWRQSYPFSGGCNLNCVKACS